MSSFWSRWLVSASLGASPPIGLPLADFGLADPSGEVRRLSEWSSAPLLVVVFVRDDCPLSEQYAATIAGLHEEFAPRGVAFLGISPGNSTGFAGRHALRFPILADVDNEAAAHLGASKTPEVVVLDARRAVRYRGRIDDAQAFGTRQARVGRRDLAVALAELLAGHAVSRPETVAVGCPIGRPLSSKSGSAPTYSRDIAPLLNRRCVTCHRPGEIGPFSLTSYQRVSPWVGAIAEAVEDGRMPPWHADPRHGRFANDPSLDARERKLIAGWAEAGAPEGDPADLPTPPSFTDGWRIPKPDLVVTMPSEFRVPARGIVPYQTFEVDPGFAEDRWVRGAEIRPGNRKVVHHCNVFLKDPKDGESLGMPGELGSFCLAATTPGTPPMLLPAGMAKRVPAGWHLTFVIHYTTVGTEQVDRTSLGLLFADPRSVRKEVATNLLVDKSLRIPPFAPDHRVERSQRFNKDVLLLGMFPHMHLRGKSFRYEATFPDGRTEVLLDVPRYDFHWQNRYELAEPRRLPAGTTLRCVAHYDNSAANPNNPDPGAAVLEGPQNNDEMFNGYFDIALADEDLAASGSSFPRLLSEAVAACGLSVLMIRAVRSRRPRFGGGPL